LDYTFYTDGSIQVEARASGYIRTAYYAGNGEYGYRIHDNLSGSMHDHVLNFKLDLDILGTANTVATSEFVPTTEKYPWSSKPVNTFKLRKSFLESEDEAGITWHPNAAKSYAVVNKEHKNRYGEYRGYKIRPLTPGIVKTVKSSKMLGKAATWAERNLWVTKRKDSEASCCHPYASLDVNAPPVVFEDYLDGEKLVQEDLVLCMSLSHP
jgi:primary-amine oxidase